MLALWNATKGWKFYSMGALTVLAAVASYMGWITPTAEQAEIATAIVGLLTLILRKTTVVSK
jgi:hypothetical protein